MSNALTKPVDAGSQSNNLPRAVRSAEALAEKGVTFFAAHLCGGAESAFTKAVLCKAELAHLGRSSITMTGQTVSAHGYSHYGLEKQVGKTSGQTLGYLVKAIR